MERPHEEEADAHVRLWELFYVMHEQFARKQYKREREHPEFVDLGGEG